MRSKGVDEIISAAPKFPDKKFVLAGIISDEYRDYELPPNVVMTGNLEAVRYVSS